MKLFKFLTAFLLFIIPLSSHADLSKENNKTTDLCKSVFSNSSGLWIASKPREWINRSQIHIKNLDLAAIFHPQELLRDSRDRFNLKTGSKNLFNIYDQDALLL